MNFADSESSSTALSWQLVLANTGYISFDQLHRNFHLHPDTIELPTDVLIFQEALWQRSLFERGRHTLHRALITECYIHLHPRIQDWQLAGTLYGLCPDAIIRTPAYPLPILLEMDTGKETAKQWRSKLTTYRLGAWANPHFGLWVIALGGNIRLSHLHNWIIQQKLPIAWHLSGAAKIDTDADFWQSVDVNSPGTATTAQRKELRYRELGKTQNLSGEEVNQRLHAGWIITAKEITNEGFLCYLKSP